MPRFALICRSTFAVAFSLSVTTVSTVSTVPANAALRARLVKDLNTITVPIGSDIGARTSTANGEVFTVANSGLWWSDGVETRQLIDVPDQFTILGQLGERTLFARGSQLMTTDGTVQGTVEVTRKVFYDHLSSPTLALPSAGYLLFFGSSPGSPADQLWRTDGTDAGTRRLTATLDDFGLSLAEFRGKTYFGVVDRRGPAWWSTDGTPQGTRVFDRRLIPDRLVPTSRFLYAFSARGSQWTLWRTDGTTQGTLMLATVSPTTVGGDLVAHTAVVGDRLFFLALDAAGATQLYTSDGTTAGTKKLTSFPSNRLFAGGGLEAVGSRVAFIAGDARGFEVWRSDGTVAGTRRFDLCPGSCSSEPQFLARLNGRLYFAAQNPVRGREVWSTDGASVRLVNDVCPGSCGSDPNAVALLGSSLLIQASDGLNGYELYRTEGTPASTTRITNFAIGAPPPIPRPFGASVLTRSSRAPHVFPATEPNLGTELWVTDGTRDGTRFLYEMTPNQAGDSRPFAMLSAGNRLVFWANDHEGQKLWGTDGTAAETREIFGDNAPFTRFRALGASTQAETFSLFAFDSFDPLWELFRTDGTPEGTFRIPPEGPVLGPRIKTVSLADRSYFVGAEPATGLEIWTTDGTIGGTHPTIDLRPGAQGSDARILGTFGNGFVFTANDGSGSNTYWSDGTFGGTHPLNDLYPGVTASDAITANRSIGAQTIFYRRSSDGTGGTDTLFAIAPGGPLVTLATFEPSFRYLAHFLGQVNGAWVIHIGVNNQGEIWSTDGTPAGTRRLFAPSDFSVPYVAVANDKLYLSVAPPGFPFRILWKTDGTTVERAFPSIEDPLARALPLGTVGQDVLLYRLGGGLESLAPNGTTSPLLSDYRDPFSEPTLPTFAGGRAYVAYDDGVHGNELWVIEPE